MSSELRRLLHCAFDHKPNTWLTARQAGWRKMRSTRCRHPLFDLQPAGSTSLLRRAASFKGNVRRKPRTCAGLAQRTGTCHPTLSLLSKLLHLGACRALVVNSENRPRRGRFFPDSPPHSCSMGQETGKKRTGAVDLQPTIPKSDRLLAIIANLRGALQGPPEKTALRLGSKLRSSV